jgi:hypothetical protein
VILAALRASIDDLSLQSAFRGRVGEAIGVASLWMRHHRCPGPADLGAIRSPSAESGIATPRV